MCAPVSIGIQQRRYVAWRLTSHKNGQKSPRKLHSLSLKNISSAEFQTETYMQEKAIINDSRNFLRPNQHHSEICFPVSSDVLTATLHPG